MRKSRASKLSFFNGKSIAKGRFASQLAVAASLALITGMLSILASPATAATPSVPQAVMPMAAGGTSVGIDSIQARLANHEGKVKGTAGNNCIRYSPKDSGQPRTEYRGHPDEVLTSHGNPSNYANCPNSLNKDTQSAVGVTAQEHGTVDTGTAFPLALVTHYNNPVYAESLGGRSGSEEYFTGKLDIRLGGFDQNPNLTYDWELWETPNSARPCANPSADNSNGCADRISFQNQISDQYLTRDGVEYKLVINGFSPVSGSTCPATKPNATRTSWWTKEEDATNACIYATLTEVSQLEIVKETVGAPSGVEAPDKAFGFKSSSSYGSAWQDQSFTLRNGDTHGPLELLESETVTITETLPNEKWSMSAVQCTDASGQEVAADKSGDEFSVTGTAAAGTVTCVVTNTYTEPTANLTLKKHVDGGSADPADWILTAERTQTAPAPLEGQVEGTTGVTKTVASGTYTLTEDLKSGVDHGDYNYAQEAWQCKTADNVTLDVTEEGEVTLPDGADVTCTVTNRAETGALKITKEITGSKQAKAGFIGGGDFDFTGTYQCGEAGEKSFSVTTDTPFVVDDIPADVSCNITEDQPTAGLKNAQYVWGAPVIETSPVTIKDGKTTAVAIKNPITRLAGGISLTKVASETADVKVGDTITYTFTAKNEGDVDLTDVTLDDGLPGLTNIEYNWPNAPGELAVGETLTVTADYVMTQDDVNAGAVINTATVTGTTPDGDKPKAEDSETVTPDTTASIAIEKSITDPDPATGLTAGDDVTYNIVVTNNGDVTLTDVTVEDPMFGGLLTIPTNAWPAGNDEGTLHSGQSTQVLELTHTVTQAEVDAGLVVTNTATATGTPFDGGDDVTDTDDANFTPADANGAISIVKTGKFKDDAPGVAGDTVEYTFTATNAGNVTLSEVTITDPMDGLSALDFDWSKATAIGVLAPGESVTATATYTVTQADVDAGSIDNLATTTGKTPGDEEVEDTDPETLSPSSQAEIGLDKTANKKDGWKAADTVTYTFTVTNTGDVTLSDITIDDQMAGLSAIEFDWANANVTETEQLAPGESVEATATYVITQADVDAGDGIRNTATAFGTPPGTDTPVEATDDEEVTTVDHDPSISLDKSASQTEDLKVNQPVTYTFVAENTGNVTLTDVTIVDPMEGLSELTFDWSGAAGEGVLAPGEVVTATATYTITQADVDAGKDIPNTAMAAGTPPGDKDPVSDEDDEVITPTSADAEISLLKEADQVEGLGVGDSVTYTFTVTNGGNVTLTGITVADDMDGLSSVEFDWDSATVTTPGELAPGESVEATATYTVTQADVDAGSVTNVATAVGTPPGDGDPVEDEDTETVTTVDPDPGIELEKSADRVEPVVAGDVITYTFMATNTGNVTLTDVTIADDMDGLSSLSFDWSGAATAGVLAPGESVSASATYTVTQADVDAGSVDNLAVATGTPPGEDPVEDEDPETVPGSDRAGIELVKEADQVEGLGVGDSVTYTFVATNVGDVTLTDVGITDPLDGLSSLSFDWSGAATAGQLAPGESVSASATYTVTQADVDAGSVTNVATAVGTPPGDGDPVEDEDTETVTTVDPDPGIELEKSATIVIPETEDDGGVTEGEGGEVEVDPSEVEVETSEAVLGDTIAYTFVVTNVGNVTLQNVTLTDEMVGLSELTYTWPGAEGILAPGEQMVATATYTVTEADIEAGVISNTAVATGTPPGDEDPVEDEDTVEVPGTEVPEEPVVPVEPEEPPAEEPPVEVPPTEPPAEEPPVEAPPAPVTPQLPATGGPSIGWMYGGVGLAVTGGGLLLATRRRQHEQQ